MAPVESEFLTAGIASRLDPSLLRKIAGQITLVEGPHGENAVQAPFNGAVLYRIPLGGEADIELAASRARAAQPAWAGLSFSARSAVFRRFHDALLRRQDEILDLIQLETGKARLHALEEVLDTAIVARYYAREAEKLLRPSRRRGALPGLTATWELRSPIGVAGFISPWNYPLSLAITDLIPALLAGNAAVLKPDKLTSYTALWAVNLLREAGLPAEVLQVVTGEGTAIGPALVRNTDFMMFTGSTATGRIIARQSAERLIGCSLELGGKNPLIVLPDASLEDAVEGAVRGCFVGAGQVCVSIERIYVHESMFQDFLDRFAARTEQLKIGPALDYSTDMGSLTSERQLANVEAHVRDAVDKGATLVSGGKRLPHLGPLFYAPTILAGVLEGMKAFAEETFGPVVSVYGFDSEDEAVRLANATPYGLSASVYTRDTARGVRIAERIRAGSVNVNEAYAAAWASADSAIGGMKESGLGRRHGAEGILKFTETQTVAVQRLLPIAPPPWMAAARWARVMTFLLKLMRRLNY